MDDGSYIFGKGLQRLFNFVLKLNNLVAKEKREVDFEPVKMVGSPFTEWETYRIKLSGVESDGSNKYYLGAKKDEKGRIWHRFVLSTLENDLELESPFCITEVCEGSYKLKDGLVYIDGNNWRGPTVHPDSDEGKAITRAWFSNGQKNKRYGLAV